MAPVTMLSRIKDGYSLAAKAAEDVNGKVRGKWHDTVKDIELKRDLLKTVGRDDVNTVARKTVKSMGKGLKNGVWYGAIATSTGTGIAAGFVVNRIGNEVRTNVVTTEKTIEDGKTIIRFVSAPRNRLGLALDPESRRLQLMGLATEIAGGVIIASVFATALNVQLGSKKEDGEKETV